MPERYVLSGSDRRFRGGPVNNHNLPLVVLSVNHARPRGPARRTLAVNCGKTEQLRY
jgi:hypothetical protein